MAGGHSDYKHGSMQVDVLGVVLKFKGGWYVGLIGLAILTAFFSIILSVFA